MSTRWICRSLPLCLAGMAGLAQAAPLTFNEALHLAEQQSPALLADAANIRSAQSAAIPAGALPDPKLVAGIDNYPVSGDTRWSLVDDFMTMQKIGIMQDVPNSAKRHARVELADARTVLAEAQRRVSLLDVRRGTALAWLARYYLERELSLFDDLDQENRLLSGWVYVDVRGRDLASVVGDLRRAVARDVKLEPGMSIAYSGQFEYMERAAARLKLVVPATLVIIFVLLFMTFSRFDEAALIMTTLPFALVGGIWVLYLLGYNMSVATGIGFIALAGVSAEFGVVMLLYLKQAVAAKLSSGVPLTPENLDDAIREGAVLRVRPKAMTVAVILAGLMPILLGSGTGSEIMSRIAAPMVGGMITAPLLSMFVIPAAFRLMRDRKNRT